MEIDNQSVIKVIYIRKLRAVFEKVIQALAEVKRDDGARRDQETKKIMENLKEEIIKLTKDQLKIWKVALLRMEKKKKSCNFFENGKAGVIGTNMEMKEMIER